MNMHDKPLEPIDRGIDKSKEQFDHLINAVENTELATVKNIIESGSVPRDILQSPEVQQAARERLIQELQSSPIYKIRDILNFNILPEETLQSPEVQQIAQARLIQELQKGFFYEIEQFLNLNILPEVTLQSPEVQQAAQECLMQELQRGYISQIKKLLDLNILPEDALQSPEVQQIAQARLIQELQKGFFYEIEQFLNLNILTEETLQSPEVQQAAQECLMQELQRGYISQIKKLLDLNILLKPTLQSPEVQQAAQEHLIRALQKGVIGVVQKMLDFNILPEDILQSPEAQQAAQESLIEIIQVRSVGIVQNKVQNLLDLNILPEVQQAAQNLLIQIIQTLKRGYINAIRNLLSLNILTQENLQSPEVQQAAQERLIRVFKQGDANGINNKIKKLLDLNILTEETLQSPEVQQAAQECLIRVLQHADSYYIHDKIQDLLNFNILTEATLQSPEVQQAAQEHLIRALQKGYIHDKVGQLLDLNILTEETLQSPNFLKKVLEESRYLLQSQNYTRVDNLIDLFELNDTEIEHIIKIYLDKSIPNKYRLAKETYSINDLRLARVRMSHGISPLEANEIEERGGSLDDLDNIREVIHELLVEEQPDIAQAWLKGCDEFGVQVMIDYMNKPDLPRHDALHFFEDILALYEQSGLSTQEFSEILRQVGRDGGVNEFGSSHETFAAICQEFRGINIEDIINEAKDIRHVISSLDKLISDIEENSPYSSWSTLKKVYDISRILRKRDIIELIKDSNIELRSYIEPLIFHKNISYTAVTNFLQDPRRFFGVTDSHAPEAVRSIKRPTAWMQAHFLGANIEDLRDAIVEGDLDNLQTLRPHEKRIFFGIPQSDMIDEDDAEGLAWATKKALGMRSKGISGLAENPGKLLSVLRKLAPEMSPRDLVNEKSLKTFLESTTHDVRVAWKEALFNKAQGESYGMSKKDPSASEYRMFLAKKSDPRAVVAGNDTASCMPFGSGKNNVYMANPNCSYLVLQKKVQGRWRTSAQSVVTINITTTKSVSKMIKLVTNNENDVHNIIDDQDLVGLPVITCDNIEVSKNSLGNETDNIRSAYEAFFHEYMDEYSDDLCVDPSRVIVGKNYTPSEIGLPDVENTFAQLAPTSYSDNTLSRAYKIPLSEIDDEEREVLRRKYWKPGIHPITVKDIFAITKLEGKSYIDNPELIFSLHNIQNTILGVSIANEHFARPDLTAIERDNDLLPTGYMIAYEGRGSVDDEVIVYINDLAVDRSDKRGPIASARTAKRLLDNFVQKYIDTYKEPEHEDDPYLPPIVAITRDQTSYKLMRSSGEKIARDNGLYFDFIETGTSHAGDDIMHNVIMVLAKSEDELHQRLEDIRERTDDYTSRVDYDDEFLDDIQ